MQQGFSFCSTMFHQVEQKEWKKVEQSGTGRKKAGLGW